MPLFGRSRGDAPRGWIAALDKVLGPIDTGRHLADFVLTGRHGDALTTLSASTQWGQRVATWESGADKDMAVLYAGFAEVEAAVLRRWGRVLDAGRGRDRWGLVLGDVCGCHWPELMIEQAALGVGPEDRLPITFADLERIAAEDGVGAADLVRAAFIVQPYSRYRRQSARDHLPRLEGFAEAVVAHRAVVATALRTGSADERVTAASVVAALDDTVLLAFADTLADAATTTSSQVRDAVRPLVARLGDAGVEPLRALATGAKPEQRARALELLAARPDQREWAVKTAVADRAASVRALTARWDAADASAGNVDEEVAELPPLPSWALSPGEADRVAARVMDGVRRGIRERNHTIRARRQQNPNWAARELPEVPTRPMAADLVRLLVADRPVRVADRLDGVPEPHTVAPGLSLLAEQGHSATTILQVMVALGWFDNPDHPYRPYLNVLDQVHARTGEPDLLTLQRMLDEVGVDGRSLVWSSYSDAWGIRLGRDWPDEQVWPFVAHNLDWVLAQSLSQQRWDVDEQAFFAAIATFPTPPPQVVDHLYAVATGTRKSLRALAQAALESDSQRATRAAAALQDGRSEVRLVAAQWLARIADPAALPALQSAWKKERQDVVRGALLDALVALGEHAETYLDPQATTATAEKYVAKGLPAALSWLDWTAVPDVTWASSGEPVPRSVVQWLCAIAVKAKSPEPDAVLRQYAALFDVARRERLATHLLTAWLREDVRPIPAAEAERRAASHAASWHSWVTKDQQSPYFGMTVEQLGAALLPGYLKTPAGSAVASKGLLAVVAACGGRDVVPPTERFLKEWYGQRAAQGKALIGMLAWVDHPSATQLVLSIGSRFRTKSFQEEAVRQAKALAERRGWTVDELADRTIPTGGFDEDGVLELPYGPRTFTAQLRPDLTVELHDPDGKTIKALPTPRQSDDADQAKDSKKAFAAAKKEVKSIASLQTQRLYEALCTERSWSVEDWTRYLLRHPVVGPALRRLVWVATLEDGDTIAFRPLDDGSLTDVDDNEVVLPAGARIRVAHDSLLTPDQVEQWTAHLADYEITPLFEQLGRGVHAVTRAMRSEREITDFTGHMLEAFALRGRAGKLGYARGQTEDGGWFYTYDKRFPTLGIVASIGFTGNFLPEENRTVALRGLSFRRETPDGGRADLTLGDVPAVLVSECWHDLRLLAAEGSGFDPDWEKKTEY